MITEAQKQLVFDINCFYQLESQKEKFTSGIPIATLPELSLVALFSSKNGQVVNWTQQYNVIYNKLKSYGLTDNWIVQLKDRINSYMQSGKTVEDFRTKFMTAIDLLIDMLLDVLRSVEPSPDIAQKIIGSIFEKDYWSGIVVQQINTVRTLTTVLGFDIKFVVDFGETLLRQD
ncbi:MAG TPA: hypothetical protein VIJ75_18975 [Hanamia sp.]